MRRFFVLLVAVSLVFAGALTQSVRAAGDWYVSTTGNDTNDCRSLATACRTIGVAIERADATEGTVRDSIGVAAGIYVENLVISKDVSISGDTSGTIIDGGGNGPVITIVGARVEISRVTIQNGRGGILNQGTLELRDTVVTGNQASRGGGIYSEGPLSVYESIIANNEAGFGCAGV